MKKSKYNIIIRRDNASLIFNSFTNSYVALSNLVCDAFEDLPIEEFKSKYEKSYYKLCENGIINGSLKFEITAKRLYAASQRVL